MEALDIAKKYRDEIIKRFDDITMILYGSTVFGVKTSDLDVCFVREEQLSQEQFQQLKYITRDFHLKNNLRIDEEVPYENKLVYTKNFIEDTLINLPFPYINEKLIIQPIIKSKEYLASKEMSKRLLLNILTVKNEVLCGDKELIKNYGYRAWEEIIRVVISYSEQTNFSVEELLKYLYVNPFTGAEGELYLGYKKNLKEKEIYLQEKVEEMLMKLEKENKMVKTLKKKYIPNEGWLRQ